MTWTPDTPLTVGQIREAIAGLPDDAQAFVENTADRPIVGAIVSQQIAWGDDDWKTGDPLVWGAEFWLGGDEEFPAPRCQHLVRLAAAFQKEADPSSTGIWREACDLLDRLVAEEVAR